MLFSSRPSSYVMMTINVLVLTCSIDEVTKINWLDLARPRKFPLFETSKNWT